LSKEMVVVNHFYWPTNALSCIKFKGENLRCINFKRQKDKNHSDIFRIVCDPSSGSVERAWLKLLVIFFLCLVGVWQRNFGPQVANEPKHIGVIFNCLLKLIQRRF